MKTSSTKKSYINLLSNASCDVTGSCHAIHHQKNVVLLDCGLIQGVGDVYTNYRVNVEQLKKLRPKTVDACIISHQNIDHVGNCPYLYARGFRGKTYIPMGLKETIELLLRDSLHINQSDCLRIQSKGRKATPFYSEQDIDITLANMVEVPYHKVVNITSDIWFEYYPAGHLIHSASVLVTLKSGYNQKKIWYSGDIGSSNIQRYVEPREIPAHFNVGIVENTYNSPTRLSSPKDRSTDLQKIETIVQDYKRVIIPSFAMMRSQIILTELYHMWEDGKLPKDIRVYFDTPLGIRLSEIFEGGEEWDKVWNWSNLHKLMEYNSSQAVQTKDEKCIVVASAGMCENGRIVSWLKSSLPKPDTHVIFIGYCPETGVAADIKSTQKEIKIDKEVVANNANYTELRSFSSHENYWGLLDTYSSLNCDRLYLVHGNQENKVEFAKVLQDKIAEQNKSYRVVAAQSDQRIYL